MTGVQTRFQDEDDPRQPAQSAPVAGLLPRAVRVVGGDRQPAAGVIGSQLGMPAPQGTRLTFGVSGGYANVASDWPAGISSDALTMEVWVRTITTTAQTIVLGSDAPGATPRFALNGDALSIYWNPSGTGGGTDSGDTTPVSDGQWHHLAVVVEQGEATFYKDGIACDSKTIDGHQSAAGVLQLAAGFGSANGFVGDLYDVRVWSVVRSAADLAAARFSPPTGTESGLVLATAFDRSDNSVQNLVNGQHGDVSGGQVTWGDLPTPPSCAVQLAGDAADYVNLNSVEVFTTDAATVECWVLMDPAGAGDAQTLMLVNDPGVASPRFSYDKDDRIGFFWHDIGYTSIDTTPITDGQWHHLAVVFDRGTVTFIKDGIPAADSFQIPAEHTSSSVFQLGAQIGSTGAFRGLMTEARIWKAARSLPQIRGFRFVALTGDEPDLIGLASLAGADPAQPASLRPFNAVTDFSGYLAGTAKVVVPPTVPTQALPSEVWTSPLTGLAPSGPVITGQGVVCAENVTDASGTSGWLRSLDLRTAAVNWSYAVETESGDAQTVVPAAVTTADGVVYAGAQSADPEQGSLAVNAVGAADGRPVWQQPVTFAGAAFLTRPVVAGGTLFVGYRDVHPTPDQPETVAMLRWFDVTTSAGGAVPLWEGGGLTDPLVIGTTAFIGIVPDDGTGSSVTAVDTAAEGHQLWWTSVPADPAGVAPSVTAGLAYGQPILSGSAGPAVGHGTVVVPLSDGSLMALDGMTGAVLWRTELSGSAVHCTPAVLGSVVCVGDTGGVLYALDLATGHELWRVDTQSPITTTDLVVQDGVLYFANQGNGLDVPPSFVTVDTASQGADVLTYDVPNADTILFGQSASNGVVYFYGRQAVYAVDMQNLIHQFSVDTALIVEDYDIPAAGAPTGSDTSYRISLRLSDELGNPRVSQAVQVWSADPVYLVNLPGSLGSPAAIGPDEPRWLQSDAAGTLTLAVSAFDDGTPTGTPNLACPPLFVWGNFMHVGEAIVIYPDHDHLTALADVQGSSSTGGVGAAPGVRFLDEATGYDGTPMISAEYRSPDALSAIASTVRNTVGAGTGPSVAARVTALVGAAPGPGRYLLNPAAMPNVVYAPDSSATPTRAYVPGVDAIFTLDLGSGVPVYQAGTFDTSRPEGLLDAEALGSTWSDIGDFIQRVVKGAEQVVKTAWQATENAVSAVVHTAESIYRLTITTVEDAVTVVTGFLKSVVSDIRAVIQWLSKLFQWENVVINHNLVKLAIVNPDYNPDQPAGADNQPGALDQLRQWVSNESANVGSGQQNAFDVVFGAFAGQGASAMAATGAGLAGQTVHTTRSGNSDPNTVYNYGGTNNAGQGRWMQQKLTEHGGTAGTTTGFSVGRSLRGSPPVDPAAVAVAGGQFVQALEDAISGSFADFPGRLRTQLVSMLDTFKDPATLLTTGLADLLGVFEVLAEDSVALFRALIPAVVALLEALLDQIVSWLAEPLDIPFVSALYQSVTGQQLTILDLVCLLAAVPATLVLDVITGSPTPPTDTDGLDGTAGAESWKILAGVASFVISNVAVVVDILSLSFASKTPASVFWSKIDFACDFAAYAMGFVAARGWSEFEDHDWAFWAATGVIQVVNFYVLVCPEGWPAGTQPVRDTIMWSVWMIMAGLYAHFYVEGYRDAPSAPGLPLAANVFAAATGIVELLVVFLDIDAWGGVVMVGKAMLGEVTDVLNFTTDVLGIVKA